jgi:hypothetical protein
MQFNNTFEVLNQILRKNDILEFVVSPTTYGLEISCFPELDFPDHQILDHRILQIDTVLTNGLELGTERTYKFCKRNDVVFGEINCKMEYSDFYNSEKSSLQNELKIQVVQILCAKFKCNETDFLDKYDFQLNYSTLEDKFVLNIIEWDNDLGKEIPVELREEIKSEMVKFTKEKSSNTFEFDCHYKFTFTNDAFVVFEFWGTDLDLNLLIDGQQYEY